MNRYEFQCRIYLLVLSVIDSLRMTSHSYLEDKYIYFILLYSGIEHSVHMILIFLIYYAPVLLTTLKISMEAVNLGYSTKNIPIAQPKEYLTKQNSF